MREDYNVTIIESMKELSAKERIRAKKSTSTAIKLDEVVTPENPFMRTKPAGWCRNCRTRAC